MKRIQPLIAVALGLTVGITITITGCASSGQNSKPTKANDQPAQKSANPVQYYCPMHPEVMQDKPGTCPKCGMELLEKQ